ncbi:hypothetical protein M758_8G034900 [Ceratodon purpureus]|nr:hypothetical protein M758_8G034900 [Ceratodon purpureus]
MSRARYAMLCCALQVRLCLSLCSSSSLHFSLATISLELITTPLNFDLSFLFPVVLGSSWGLQVPLGFLLIRECVVFFCFTVQEFELGRMFQPY